LDRVVDAVRTATDEPPVLIANAPDGPTWRPELRTIPDVRPGSGSLGGIHTAIVSGAGPVLCVAWDMPFVTIELLRALLEGSTGWDAFLPESGGRRGVEPLCAVYGPACAAAIERQNAPPGGAGGGARAPEIPAEDGQAGHPPRRQGPARQGLLAPLARRARRARPHGGARTAGPVGADGAGVGPDRPGSPLPRGSGY